MNLNRIHKAIKFTNGNVVYDRGVTRLLTDEGYVTFSETGATIYHYYQRDHLGNIRVVMGQTGAVEQVSHYYAFGGLMRESTNPYKYGGKEMDRFSGLDAYDFGARSYFADRIQWGTMDPLCEKYYNVSPYAYCHNNPVMFIDMNGMKPDSISAALMSLLAYGYDNDAYNELLNHQWSFVSHHESVSGFKYNIYKKGKSDGNYEYACAYAGTDTDEGGEFIIDALNDVVNYFGCITPQYFEAAIKALGISGEEEWTFVGHSLGGGLAALSSKLTGKDAITFNPASLTGKVNVLASFVSHFRGGHITQYRAFANGIFGGLLGDPVNMFQDLTRRHSQGKVIPVYVGKNCSHGIQDIIDAFHRNGKRR